MFLDWPYSLCSTTISTISCFPHSRGGKRFEGLEVVWNTEYFLSFEVIPIPFCLPTYPRWLILHGITVKCLLHGGLGPVCPPPLALAARWSQGGAILLRWPLGFCFGLGYFCGLIRSDLEAAETQTQVCLPPKNPLGALCPRRKDGSWNALTKWGNGGRWEWLLRGGGEGILEPRALLLGGGFYLRMA